MKSANPLHRSTPRLLLAGILLTAGCAADPNETLDRSDAKGAGASGGGIGGNGVAGAGGADFGNSDQRIAVSPSLPSTAASTDDAMSDAPKVCDSAEIVPELRTERVPGNVLIVFDRSGSMNEGWAGSASSKVVTARSAVTAALVPLQDDLAYVGAILFPNPEQGQLDCSVAPITSHQQFPFVSGPAFLQQWDAYWTSTASTPVGPTPLLYAEQQADAALQDAALEHTTVVIIITDGVPNCLNGVGNADEPLANLTPLPASWKARGIETYVVGLPGSDAATAVLDGIAMAGGTGAHIPANDAAALEAQIAGIVKEAAIGETFPCFIDVDPAPENPDEVHLVVTDAGTKRDVPRTFQDGSQAWSTNADGTHIDLHGDFCSAVQAGDYENVSVEFGCVQLPPLPPPSPD